MLKRVPMTKTKTKTTKPQLSLDVLSLVKGGFDLKLYSKQATPG